MNTSTRNKKTKAPNWTSYFGRAKKKIKVIYFIEFRSRNKSRTCYTSLKKIAEECNCSVDTVYDAVTLAISIGVLEKIHFSTVFGASASGGLLWNKQVLLTWIGDTDKTAGEEVFGEASRFYAQENPDQTPAKNPDYNSIQGTSLKEKKEEKLSPLFDKIKEELKDYSENQISQFWSDLQGMYKAKLHFLSVDLAKHLERFKRNNPLKRCSSCGEVHNSYGSYCNPCWQHYQYKEQEKTLERDREAGAIEVPDWQRYFREREDRKVREVEKARLEKLLESHLSMIDLIESEFRLGRMTQSDYEQILNLRKEKIGELMERLRESIEKREKGA